MIADLKYTLRKRKGQIEYATRKQLTKLFPEVTSFGSLTRSLRTESTLAAGGATGQKALAIKQAELARYATLVEGPIEIISRDLQMDVPAYGVGRTFRFPSAKSIDRIELIEGREEKLFLRHVNPEDHGETTTRIRIRELVAAKRFKRELVEATESNPEIRAFVEKHKVQLGL